MKGKNGRPIFLVSEFYAVIFPLMFYIGLYRHEMIYEG